MNQNEDSRCSSVVTIDDETEGRSRDSSDKDGILPGSSTDVRRQIKLHRIVRELQFSHPGDAAAVPIASACSVVTETGHRILSHRSRRNEVVVEEEESDVYTPHHDGDGLFVTEDGRHVRLCDCLSKDCEGCHVRCKKCGTRYCGPACQRDRDWVPLKIEFDADDAVPIYHPYITRR